MYACIDFGNLEDRQSAPLKIQELRVNYIVEAIVTRVILIPILSIIE